MTPYSYDESDARIRPARSTRPRSKDRPAHADAIFALVTTVDRGRTTCITDDAVIVTAMKARELAKPNATRIVAEECMEIIK